MSATGLSRSPVAPSGSGVDGRQSSFDELAEAEVVPMSDAVDVQTRPSHPAHDVRAGAIGPVRREIVFEPLRERPAPAESPAADPAPSEPASPKEPVPDRS